MNYQQAVAYMTAALPMFHRIGPAAYKANLDNTIRICELTGHPEKDLICVHVAGTNGKGSVSHLLASVFQAAGYKTGLYTSPHLRDFRERIRINGAEVSESWVADFITTYQHAFETIKPSFFEMSTAMAFRYFRDHHTEIAIIETGLGGRLDSTNVITPELSIITNISLDHTELLGNTPVAIAAEKAGIIKDHVPVVIGEYNPETEIIFRNTAFNHRSPLYFASDNYNATLLNIDTAQLFLEVRITDNKTGDETVVRSGLSGHYQRHNLVTVWQALQLLKNKWKLSDDAISEGLAQVVQATGLRGRWEILGKNPLIVADTGHNESGIHEVMDMIRSTPYTRLHIVLGVVGDKDLSRMLSQFPADAHYYFCKANIPRGLPADLLQAKASLYGLHGQVYERVEKAFKAARSEAKPDDLLFIGGSTFTVAEVL